ncbi:hypothetical protein PsYK624_068250 [Phanerochaete sordida]|uniref:Uncharacterized protein n=1 Tax=Phanerochaete sordida TaxID=48140 RepID=A0A9P3G9C5_9APHY|nr:hypothetical protein PsYK624_068250 [Phanerochaete sordida]
MAPRTPLPVPLIRKPKFLGSPSMRDVRPEHRYIVRFNRRLQDQARASKPFKAMFKRERTEERDCREKVQEEVVDYRAAGQSPKRKAVEPVGIRRTLTRSLCSLPRRAIPVQVFVSLNEAMDVDIDEAEGDSMDVDDVPSPDGDVEMEDATTPTSFIIPLIYPPFVPPRPSPPPPPTYIPTRASNADTSTVLPSRSLHRDSTGSSGLRGSADRARRTPRGQRNRQFMAFTKASHRGTAEASTPAPAKRTPASPMAGPSGEDTVKKAGRPRRRRTAATGDYKATHNDKNMRL